MAKNKNRQTSPKSRRKINAQQLIFTLIAIIMVVSFLVSLVM